MPFQDQIDELNGRLGAVEAAVQQEHKSVETLTGRVTAIEETLGSVHAAVSRVEAKLVDNTEAVDGLHTGILEVAKGANSVARAAQKAAERNLNVIPPWLGAASTAILIAAVAAVLGDLGVHALHVFLGWG